MCWFEFLGDRLRWNQTDEFLEGSLREELAKGQDRESTSTLELGGPAERSLIGQGGWPVSLQVHSALNGVCLWRREP